MKSRGQTSKGKLKGAERKAFHRGQFYTPVETAGLLHHLCGLDEVEGRSVLDSSAGCGRLLAGLTQHRSTAIEIDAAAAASIECLKATQPISCSVGDFLEFDACGFDVALLNPPFNLVMRHRRIREFGIGTDCAIGTGTKANSIYAALAHALEASAIVLAIVPRGALTAGEEPEKTRFLARYGARLLAVLNLPGDTFKDEGTLVMTQVAVFLPHETNANITCGDAHDDELVDSVRTRCLDWLCANPTTSTTIKKRGEPRNLQGLPEQGDKALRLTRKGRNLVLQPDSKKTYYDALDILCGRPWDGFCHSFKYGDRPRAFALDLEAYLIQPNPVVEFDAAVQDLRDAGFTVDVDVGMRNWMIKTARRNRWRTKPIRRWAEVDGYQARMCWFHARTAMKGRVGTELTDLQQRSIAIEIGERVNVLPQSDGTVIVRGERGVEGRVTKLLALLHIDLDGAPDARDRVAWREVFPGLEFYCLSLFKHYLKASEEKRLAALLHPFALRDAIELTARGSALYNADMGLGKTRMGVGVALLSGVARTLFSVKSRHVSEWLEQFEQMGFDRAEINVIDSPAKVHALKRFNLISYSRLSSIAAKSRRTKNTYADMLRRRVSLLVADEAQLLSNPTSQRSLSVARLAAKRTLLMTGTAMRGYCRNVYNLLRLVGGDATVRQPYGLGNRPHLTSALLHTAHGAAAGTEAFVKHFIEAEQASEQFLANLSNGYRRGEKPRVQRVVQFREYLAPLLLRRSQHEPEVRANVALPVPETQTILVNPSHAHALSYYSAGRVFVKWLEEELKKTGRVRNYGELTHHLSQLHWASSFPMHNRDRYDFREELTAVQAQILADACSVVPNEDKAILVFENPEQVEFMATQLRVRGKNVVFIHGGLPIEDREQILYEQFRNGDAQWMVASVETINEAYNLPQANHVWICDGAWEPFHYHQISARILRPEQRKQCFVRHYLARGFLSEYKHRFALEKDHAISEAIDFDDGKETPIPKLDVLLRLLSDQYERAA